MATRTDHSQAATPSGAGTSLVLHPRITTLHMHREALRAQLAALIEMQTTLVEHETPYLEALYAEQLGQLEFALLGIQARNACLLRRIELLRAVLNRGATVTAATATEIDAEIRNEQFEWEERLRAEERRIRDAGATLRTPALSAPDTKSLKEVYRRLVRRLHPDVADGETARYLRYWNEVQCAYRHGDLQYLELLAEIICGDAPDVGSPPALHEHSLEADITRLERLVRAQIERLAELRRTPPLCYERQLRDPEWVKAKQREIRLAIEREEKRHRRLSEELQLLLPADATCSPSVH